MNILYLHTHDMGRYNGLYGQAIKTPVFCSIASDGTLFREAFCACPTCSPSRSALLTGQYPHVNGMIGLAHRHFKLKRPVEHLANFLSENGYITALAGIQHETDDISTLGYSVVLSGSEETNDRGIQDENNAAKAAEFINNHKGDKPFFLSVGFFWPHRPYKKHDGIVDPDYVIPPHCVPDTAEAREDFADYAASVMHSDMCAGTVIDALKAAGIYDETMIILTTDHGIAFPHMKCNLYDTGIGVMLALKLPASLGRTIKVSDALVSHMDIYPTICELIGINIPDRLQGKSLLPLLGGKAEKLREELFFEITYHAAYEPLRAVRTERYKLIKRFDTMKTPVLPNIDDGYTKRRLLKSGFGSFLRPDIELYDIEFDPTERNNVADIPEYKEIKAELELKLEAWMIATDDPILKGLPVPKPDGALVNRQTDIDPLNINLI